MEQALKQRLVGAVVITALAAIFVPMFFEDSVDDSRREVNNSDLALPAPPEQLLREDNPIPQTPQQVLHAPQEEPVPAAGEEMPTENTAAAGDEQFEEPLPAENAEEQLPPVQPPAQAEEPPRTAPAAQVSAESGMSAVQRSKPLQQTPPPSQAAVVNPGRTTATPGLQRWVLQLGSFSKKGNAEALVGKLRGQGFNAYTESFPVAGKGTMFRVKVGPELEKKSALATQKKLQQRGTKALLLSE
jgi:DedD protein